MNIKEMKKKLEIMKKDLLELEFERSNFELDPDDYENEFDLCLDDTNDLFMGFYPSDILKSCDPIMYRQDLLNYVDSVDLESNDQYIDITEKIEDLENEIEDLEIDIEIEEDN